MNTASMENKIVFSFIPVLKNPLVFWTIFILMCLVLWMLLLFLIQNIMYHLLMIIQEEHLFIFLRTNQKCSVDLRNLKALLKITLEERLNA